MVITGADGATYSLNIKIPKCKCTKWASVFGTYRTSHQHNCNFVTDEIIKFGFLKVGLGNGHTFICRIRSSPNFVKFLFKSPNAYAKIIHPNQYKHYVKIDELAKFLSSHDLFKSLNIDARPLIIDRILYMRYYLNGEYLYHEEYSYIEDEYETTKLLNKSPSSDN